MKTHWINSGAPIGNFNWEGGQTLNPNTGDLESVIDEPNFKNIWWLAEALNAAKKVARVKLPNGSASGFLIGKNLFLTNNHVFEDMEDARQSLLQFNYQMTADGMVDNVDVWKCDPDRFFKTNSNLDYSIVAVEQKNGASAGVEFGFFDLNSNQMVRINQRVNIIQHPRGRFKEIAFRDNQVKAVEEKFIQYLTDTDYGTSGSPVLDDWFNVVALHNQRVRDPQNRHRWYRNQGFRIDKILDDMGELPN